MSTAPSSSNRASFFFDIPGTDFDFRVLGFEAIEAISSPFQVNVTVACEDMVAFEQVAGKKALLTVSTEGATENGNRYFHGDLCKFKMIGDNGDYIIYRARLVPAIWRLSLEQDCRIFQNSTLQAVVKTVLAESGITSDDYKFVLKEKELKSQYCVQYNETDLNFISRLLEEEGIFYFFEHFEDRHVLVFCDFTFFCTEIPGNPVIPFNPSGGMVPETESISAFNLSERLCPDAVTTRSFNYKRTGVDLTAEQTGKEGRAEIYEFSGTFASDRRGRKLAKIRLEEHSALERKAKGESNCSRLIPGFTFTVDGFGSGEEEDPCLLLAVEHVGDQPQSLDALGSGSAEYWNGFICIPASVNLRPSRITPKPVIPGMQTAIVTGPPGEEIYHDHFGRVKVQFHWDRKGTMDDKSSCWLRYAQGWGGCGWGMQFIPRVGDEVLVAFLDGDPDRPVIVGSLYNSANMPLYNPADMKTVSSVKTRSYPNGGADNFHELRFDDRKGSEEIYLQSEKDWNILVKNDKAQVVGHDDSLLVKNDCNKSVGMNQSESIGVNKSIRVGSNHEEIIGANMTTSIGVNKSETVGANAAETVGLAKNVAVGGMYHVTVGGVMNETVAGARTEEIGLAKAVTVGADMTETVAGARQMNVGSHLEITAGESVQITCGNSTLRMNSDGSIFINGTCIELAASGTVKATAEDIQLN